MDQLHFTLEDCKTPEKLERLFRQLNLKLAQADSTKPASLDLNQLAVDLAPLISKQLEAPGIAPINLVSLLPATGSGGTVLEDTHANRLTLYPAANYSVGTLFYETDRTVVYVVTLSSGVLVWTYIAGIYADSLANIPTDLGTNDNNLLFRSTDYGHLHRWTGAGAVFTWGPGDDGSDFYAFFENAPSGYAANAWQICDGSTVDRSNSDGTTTSVTVPNVSTAAYIKGANASAAVAAASGLTTAVSGGTPTGTVSQPTFTGDAVAAASTNATPDLVAPDVTGTGVSPVTTATGTVSQPTFTGSALAGHDHGPNTLELRNKQARMYFRR